MVKLRDFLLLDERRSKIKEFILLILCKKDKKTSFSILLQIESFEKFNGSY